MAIAARISRFRTRPYEPQELAEMDITENERTKAGRYEKVLAEELMEEIAAEDLGDLRQRVLQICEAYSPNPIIVRTPQNNEDPLVKHSFLIEKGYSSTDSDAVLETIIFRPKNPESYQEKREREMQVWKSKRATEAEQADFMKKAVPRILAESAKSFASSYEQTLKELGFANNDEFKSYFADLNSRRSSFATEEQFFEYLGAEWDKRIEEARARHRKASAPSKPSLAGQLSSILNDEMTILCRIIGKNSVLVSMYQQYYFRWHHISDPVFSVSNVAEDRLTTRFVYGRDLTGG